MKLKAFFIIFIELSIKQIQFFLEGESPVLRGSSYISFNLDSLPHSFLT